MSAPSTRYADYLDFLHSLHSAGADFFVEGGQAVNFWAEYIESSGCVHALDPLRPFTSKDCDVWVSSNAWEKIKRKPGGMLRKSESPADGSTRYLDPGSGTTTGGRLDDNGLWSSCEGFAALARAGFG